MKANVTGIVLAGGKSARMGTEKAFIPFLGKNLIEHSLDLLRSIFSEVLISSNNTAFGKYNLPVVADAYSNIGPMGGMYSSLTKSRNQFNVFLPCDMPLVNQGHIYQLLKNVTNDHKITAFTYNNHVDPLLACYSKDILPLIEAQISKGDNKLQNLFFHPNSKLIPLDGNMIMKNINTASDLTDTLKKFKHKLPNMALIAGDGRNVGKTFLACSIINHLSKNRPVIGIKTSPHFHASYLDSDIVAKSGNYIIVEEKCITGKDSSLMLQAGASKVYFIMAKQEFLPEAFEILVNRVKDKIIVSESGGLNEFIVPGVFFFIKGPSGTVTKRQYLQYNPVIVSKVNNQFDFNLHRLGFQNNYITINHIVDGNI